MGIALIVVAVIAAVWAIFITASHFGLAEELDDTRAASKAAEAHSEYLRDRINTWVDAQADLSDRFDALLKHQGLVWKPAGLIKGHIAPGAT